MKLKYILSAVAAVLIIAAVAHFYGRGKAPAGQLPLKSINAQNVGEIRSEFNAAKDDIRVLLFLPPT